MHEKLRKGNQKYLSDFYYSTEQMNEWKNNCLLEQEQLVSKQDKLVQALKQIKDKIKEERDFIQFQRQR